MINPEIVAYTPPDTLPPGPPTLKVPRATRSKTKKTAQLTEHAQGSVLVNVPVATASSKRRGTKKK
jgi:hypothetical protein